MRLKLLIERGDCFEDLNGCRYVVAESPDLSSAAIKVRPLNEPDRTFIMVRKQLATLKYLGRFSKR